MAMTHAPLHERARGRWHGILPAIGISEKFLKRKNGPCPMCGGKDRWRFTDIDGKGTWYCNNCHGGNGIALVMKFTGLPFREAAGRIERLLGEAAAEPIRAERSEASKRASWHPAMLAMVSDPAGRPATIHKTYITAVGTKAPVEKVRMFCAGSVPPGSAVRLTPLEPVLGLAEGIETALSATKMFGVPTWAALSDRGVEKFEPPVDTKRMVIFADNDVHGAGQRAAYSAAARLVGRLEVEVRIPEKSGTDWNDMLLGCGSG